MSSASPSTPSPVELENLGVLFVGFVVATVFYGLTFFQTYIYYSRYPRDSQWIKCLVGTLFALDTASSALVSEVLYYYLIILFDVNVAVLYATTTFCVQYMLSILLTFISQFFFIFRVFQVTRGSRLVTLVLVFLSFIALVFGLTATGQMFAQRRLSAFGSPQMEITAAISLIAGMVADMIMFTTLCYSLRRAKYPEMAVPDGFLAAVATVLVCRGLAFTVVQIAYLCVFIAAPSRQFWIPLQMTASKIYVNTLLGHLNSRDVRHGKGLNEEDSLSNPRSSTNGQLSDSIRLNVTDVKAITQSVNFTGEGTDLESRKVYRDEHGNEYAQVSVSSGSTQSQSQTDNGAGKAPLSGQS